MSKTAETSYDAKYDILKLVLSVMVVAIHAGLYPRVLYPWLRIAVPLFFIISSYFLFSKLKTIPINAQWGIIKKYTIRNFKLYIFWTVVLLPITLYIRRDSLFSKGVLKGIIKYLYNLIWGGGFGASWFIFAIVIGVLIVWWLSKVGHVYIVGLISIAFFCIVTIWSSYQSVFQSDSLFIKILKGYSDVFENPVFSFPAAIFWVFIGKCFAENKIKIFTWIISLSGLFISLAALYLEWKFVRNLDGSFNNDSYFTLVPVCIFFFMCFQKIKTISNRYASYARQLSIIIYVTHISIINIIRFVYKDILHINSEIIVFISALPCCVLIYVAIYYICHRYKDRKISSILKYSY